MKGEKKKLIKSLTNLSEQLAYWLYVQPQIFAQKSKKKNPQNTNKHTPKTKHIVKKF